jgi:hypothetical protein
MAPSLQFFDANTERWLGERKTKADMKIKSQYTGPFVDQSATDTKHEYKFLAELRH